MSHGYSLAFHYQFDNSSKAYPNHFDIDRGIQSMPENLSDSAKKSFKYLKSSVHSSWLTNITHI